MFKRHQQHAEGGNQKGHCGALACQREHQRDGHHRRARGCNDSYGLSQSLERRQRAGF